MWNKIPCYHILLWCMVVYPLLCIYKICLGVVVATYKYLKLFTWYEPTHGFYTWILHVCAHMYYAIHLGDGTDVNFMWT